MAGFETIVRPVILPGIRPAPRYSVVPEADPAKGLAVIRGSSAKTIDLPYSFSVSSSQSRPVEKQRRVDVVRVYQEEAGDAVARSTVNRDNYVDIEIANQITMADGAATSPYRYANAGESSNVSILSRNEIRRSGL